MAEGLISKDVMTKNRNEPEDGMPAAAKIWFWLVIGAFVMVIALMFGLVAWRDYREGDWKDAFFTLTIPIAMVLFYLIDRMSDRFEKQAWTARWPRIWKALKDAFPAFVFIPFIVLSDLDYSKPWFDLLIDFLQEFLFIFGIAFLGFFLFGLIRDWHRGKI